MVLTPLIRAGIFYNLHQEAKGERGLFFFTGMRKLWKPVTLFYLVELILTFAPGYWILPKILPILLNGIQEPVLFASCTALSRLAGSCTPI